MLSSTRDARLACAREPCLITSIRLLSCGYAARSVDTCGYVARECRDTVADTLRICCTDTCGYVARVQSGYCRGYATDMLRGYLRIRRAGTAAILSRIRCADTVVRKQVGRYPRKELNDRACNSPGWVCQESLQEPPTEMRSNVGAKGYASQQPEPS